MENRSAELQWVIRNCASEIIAWCSRSSKMKFGSSLSCTGGMFIGELKPDSLLNEQFSKFIELGKADRYSGL